MDNPKVGEIYKMGPFARYKKLIPVCIVTQVVSDIVWIRDINNEKLKTTMSFYAFKRDYRLCNYYNTPLFKALNNRS